MPLGSSTKRYETPNHPFQGERIAGEHDLITQYGLTNKEELWRAQSELRRIRREARQLLGQEGPDTEEVAEEAQDFLARLYRYGILDPEDGLSDVLALEVNDILERRLQTVVYRKGMANTPDQARQFVTHGHITIDGQRTHEPAYTVEVDEEAHIDFDAASPLADDLHPERADSQ